MRQITRKIVGAFERREPLTIDNSRTDGTSLWLFGNKIAEWREGGLWASNAGWDSRTTNERLNGLTGVHVRKQRGTLLLNDRVWDGRWVNVHAWNEGAVHFRYTSPLEENVQERDFDVTSEWMHEFGYSKPVHSVFHTLVEANLEAVEQKLSEAGIPSRRMESDTEGMYCPNYFIVVYPEDVERALNILNGECL